VPNKNAVHVRMLMEELDALNDGIWNERMLCSLRQERLFLYGRWQDGLEPQTARTASEQEHTKRFDDLVQKFRNRQVHHSIGRVCGICSTGDRRTR